MASETQTGPAGHGPRLGDLIEAARGVLRRRLWLLLGITGGICLLAFAVIFMMPAKYDATTRLRIDPSRNPMAQDQSQGVLNAEAIETEVGVMTSLELAREVVNRLHLERDPEFASAIDPAKASDPAERLNAVARKVMRNVGVGRDKLSYIIALNFRSRDPQKAAQIANTYAEAYLDLRVRSQVGTSSRQADFFRGRLKELGTEVNSADSQLADYRARAGISENNGTGTITDQQITSLASQLATAEADAAAAQSNASVARAQVAKGGLDAVAEVRSSSVIGDLRRQRAEIVRDFNEAQTRYGEKYPEMIRIRNQLAGIDDQIHDEANRVVSSLQAQAAAAQAQVNSLRSTMGTLQGERASNTRASANAERLEREAASARAAYDKISQMSLESTQASRSSIAQAEVVDRARPPSGPTSPNRPLLGALSVAIAFAVALGTVIVLEMAQGGLRTASEIAERYGLPVLASVVLQGGKAAKRESPADRIGVKGTTLYSESIRILRAALFGGYAGGGSARVVAITSALPDEGKTTTSLSLARMLAVNGTRTLLIDCDLRNSGLRPLVGGTPGAGLVEVMDETVALADAVTADQVAKLDVLTVAEELFTSRDLFDGDRMAHLLEEAKAHYGAIVLDLPPVLGVADSRTLARLVDKVAFVVRWGKTSPHAVDAAIEALTTDEVNLAGVVFAMVDPASQAAGGVYYSGSYANYYRNA